MPASATIALAFSTTPKELDPVNTPGWTVGKSSADNFDFTVAADEAQLHRVIFPEHATYNYAGSSVATDSVRWEHFPDLDDTGPASPIAVQDDYGNPISFTDLRLIAIEVKARVPFQGTKATGTITSTNTEVADGDTITIDGVTYRFKNTMAAINDVKRHGTVADTTLANLQAAINGTGTAGVEWYTGTVVHPTVAAGAVTAHTLPLTARDYGTAGNAIATTDTSAQLSLGAPTLTGGLDTSSPPVVRPLEGTVTVRLTSDILPGASSSFVAEWDAPGLFIFAAGEAWTPGSGGRITVTFDTDQPSPKTDQDVNAVVTIIFIGTP